MNDNDKDVELLEACRKNGKLDKKWLRGGSEDENLGNSKGIKLYGFSKIEDEHDVFLITVMGQPLRRCKNCKYSRMSRYGLRCESFRVAGNDPSIDEDEYCSRFERKK